MTENKTRTMIITSLFIALTLVFTMFVNVRLPLAGNGGLIHLGNIPLFVAIYIFGRKIAAISASIGMALFDLLSGWTAWAPFTLIIVALMGYAAGTVYDYFKQNKILALILTVATAVIIKVIGYYIAEVVLFGNLIAPLGSIPGNILQVTMAGIISAPAVIRIKNLVHIQ